MLLPIVWWFAILSLACSGELSFYQQWYVDLETVDCVVIHPSTFEEQSFKCISDQMLSNAAPIVLAVYLYVNVHLINCGYE